jgi:hypothetical protein
MVLSELDGLARDIVLSELAASRDALDRMSVTIARGKIHLQVDA